MMIPLARKLLDESQPDVSDSDAWHAKINAAGMSLGWAPWESHNNIYEELLVGPTGWPKKWNKADGFFNRPYEEVGVWSLGYYFNDDTTTRYNAGRRLAKSEKSAFDEDDYGNFSKEQIARLGQVLNGESPPRFVDGLRL